MRFKCICAMQRDVTPQNWIVHVQCSNHQCCGSICWMQKHIIIELGWDSTQLCTSGAWYAHTTFATLLHLINDILWGMHVLNACYRRKIISHENGKKTLLFYLSVCHYFVVNLSLTKCNNSIPFLFYKDILYQFSYLSFAMHRSWTRTCTHDANTTVLPSKNGVALEIVFLHLSHKIFVWKVYDAHCFSSPPHGIRFFGCTRAYDDDSSMRMVLQLLLILNQILKLTTMLQLAEMEKKHCQVKMCQEKLHTNLFGWGAFFSCMHRHHLVSLNISILNNYLRILYVVFMVLKQ